MTKEVGGPSNTVISHSPLKREYGRFQPPWPWASLFGSAVSLSFYFERLGCLSRWRGSIQEVIERIGRLFNDWVLISMSLTCNNRLASAPAPVAASESPSPKCGPRSACRTSAAGESFFSFGLAPRETEARWLARSPRDGPHP